MEFKVGDRVIMARTNKPGTISALLKQDMVQVKLDGGLGYLPAPAHALTALVGARLQPTVIAEEQTERTTPTDGGIQLAFDPMYDSEGVPESYQLYLLNGSGSRILYEIKVATGDNKRAAKFGPLPAGERLKYELIPYHWLNERLTIELDVRAVVEGGTGPRNYLQLKIKPKQFFSSYREVASLSRGAHLYTVFPKISATSVAERESAPSLRAITRAQMKQSAQPLVATDTKASIQERIDFEDTLDLHLNVLVDDPNQVPKEKALQLQMSEFDAYMDMALRLDVKQVYVIHGVGNGVLKEEVHKRLKHVPFVRKFHNSYHPRYGYGATEVLFD